MMEAGLQFIACSLFPQYVGPNGKARYFATPGLPTFTQPTCDSGIPSCSDSSSAPYINSKTLQFIPPSSWRTCCPDSVSARVPSLAARPPSGRCRGRSCIFTDF